MADSRNGTTSTAFLLAQVGFWAAEQFGDRLTPIGLTRPEAGLLWIINANPDASQQELAELLGVAPSRMVALLDDLEQRDLAIRQRSNQDRRIVTVELTETGRQTLRRIAGIAREHDEDVCAPLSEPQREQLHGLLRQIAQSSELAERVHPGYSHL